LELSDDLARFLLDESVEETVERGHFLQEDAEQIRAAARAVPLP
jgi:hypothetical protein